MNAQSNGRDDGPLAGWAIVQAQGLTVIGRCSLPMHGVERVLAPVFELKPQMAMSPQGMQLAHVALPVWLLGIREFEIPQGAIVEACESFTREQRVRLHAAVQQAEAMQEQFRNEGARVVVAPANALRGLEGGKKP